MTSQKLSVQEDFDEFSDVDDLYSSLPLDKVESLEDLVTICPPSLVKVWIFPLLLHIKLTKNNNTFFLQVNLNHKFCFFVFI